MSILKNKKYFSLAILAFAFFCVPTNSIYGKTKFKKKHKTVKHKYTHSNISPDIVLSELKKLKVQHPELVLRQLEHESNHFKSRLSIRNKNISGMKKCSRRKTTSIGYDRNGYAIYKTYNDCLTDYALLQRKFYKNLTKEQYLKKLCKGYSKDKLYAQKLRKKNKKRRK